MADEQEPLPERAPDLDSILRDAKPAWQKDGGGVRGLNPPVTGKQPAPDPNTPEGRWPIKVIQQAETPPFPPVTPTVQPVEPQEDVVADSNFPFKVKLSKDDFGFDIFSVYPGYVTTIMPTLGGTALTADPPPTDSASAGLSIYLSIHIDTADPTNNFRSGIDTATVITSASETELTVVWDDPDTQVSGDFFVKIADLTTVAGALTVVQVLRNNLITFAIAGDEVIILVGS
jgi:hypothetical protein